MSYFYVVYASDELIYIWTNSHKYAVWISNKEDTALFTISIEHQSYMTEIPFT